MSQLISKRKKGLPWVKYLLEVRNTVGIYLCSLLSYVQDLGDIVNLAVTQKYKCREK